MSHHNFYESLGLDRSKDSAALRAEINEKLGAGGLTDALRDELQVASQVLGDSRRRAAYDSRLDDPNAPTITVAALRELARVDFGPEPKPEPKLVKPKPKQYFPDTDPSGRAVTVQQPYAYPQPPQGYAYPPQYQQQYQPQYQAEPEEKKKKSGASVPLIMAIVLVLAGIGAGGWWLWDNAGEPWEADDQAVADAFPRILPEKNGQRGWQNMKCESKAPEDGQEARIRCSNKELGVSVIDYGTPEARDAVLPEGEPDTIGNAKCSAKSYKMEGVTPPAFTLAPEGADGRYLLVVNGNEAESKRMNLNMCDKTRE